MTCEQALAAEQADHDGTKHDLVLERIAHQETKRQLAEANRFITQELAAIQIICEGRAAQATSVAASDVRVLRATYDAVLRGMWGCEGKLAGALATPTSGTPTQEKN